MYMYSRQHMLYTLGTLRSYVTGTYAKILTCCRQYGTCKSRSVVIVVRSLVRWRAGRLRGGPRGVGGGGRWRRLPTIAVNVAIPADYAIPAPAVRRRIHPLFPTSHAGIIPAWPGIVTLSIAIVVPHRLVTSICLAVRTDHIVTGVHTSSDRVVTSSDRHGFCWGRWIVHVRRTSVGFSFRRVV